MTRRRIWATVALLAVVAAALAGWLGYRKLRWPGDPAEIAARWREVEAWGELDPWGWDAELAAIVDGLAELDPPVPEERWRDGARELLAWHAADPGTGRWRGLLDDDEAAITQRLGSLLLEGDLADRPGALPAALRLAARLRREGSMAHFLVGVQLAGRALERARGEGLDRHRGSLERWRPRTEEAFAAFVRDAAGTIERVEAGLAVIPAEDPFAKAREWVASREVAVAKDAHARRLTSLREVRDDLDALAARASEEPVGPSVATLLPAVHLLASPGGGHLRFFAELLDDYEAALGPAGPP